MMDRMMDMDGMMGGWGPFGLLGMLFNLLLWVGIVALIAWGVVRISSRRQAGRRQDSAEEILRGRFVRGEMNAEEYRRSLETLRREGSPQGSYEDYVRQARDELRSGYSNV